MTGLSAAGALLGAALAAGVLLVVTAARAARNPSLADRVLPYVRDVVPAYRPRQSTTSAFARALVDDLARRLDRLLGGSHSVRRRLERASLEMTVHDFRVSQALWGLVGLVAGAALTVLVALRDPARAPPLAVLTGVACVLGLLLRENRLTAQAVRRERAVIVELPVLAELLALAVAAGEGPVTAIERVVRRSHGELSRDLGRVVREVRTGTPLTLALDGLASRSGVPAVGRFAETLVVSVERGTPLADVLHAQAGDAREAARRQLIETGASREVLMMVPVVFLVLPVTVVFAFWPGVVGLSLTP